MTRRPLRIHLPNDADNPNQSEVAPIISADDLADVFQICLSEERRDTQRSNPLDLQGTLKEMQEKNDPELLELGQRVISLYSGTENSFRRCVAAIVYMMRNHNTDESVQYAQDEVDRAYRQALTRSQTE